jgi:hypothetical protein
MNNNNNEMRYALTEGHIRIRSKIYLLEYPVAPLEKVKEALMVKFKLARYFIKKERCQNRPDYLLVLLEFDDRQDFYATKFSLTIEGTILRGCYRSVLDREIALLYALKSSNKPDYITNMCSQVVVKYLCLLEYCGEDYS